MKVKLIKEANYDFNEGKFTAIPSEVFTTLVGECNEPENTDTPKVIMFENKEEYLNNGKQHNIDYNKSVYVNQKGQIFCFIKQDENVEDGATDTKED